MAHVTEKWFSEVRLAKYSNKDMNSPKNRINIATL